MPRRCCVPGCKSNYDKTVKIEGTVSTFSFPKNEDLRKKWLKAIPRKLWAPSDSSVVCIKHFSDSEVIKTFKKVTLEGVIDAPLDRLKLVDDAVPSIFQNVSSYLSKPKQPPRKSASERKEKITKSHVNAVDNFLNEDNISCYDDLVVSKPAMDVLSKTELTSLRCDACLAVISGVRYHCMQCADVDFCSECEARGNHDTHYVLRVPQYKPLAEVRSVLTAVQRALDSALAAAQELITIKDELDLKQEEDSETTIDPLLDPLSEPIFCNTSQENHHQKSVTNFNESNCDKAKEDMIRRHNDSDETNYLFFQKNNNEDRVVLPVYKSKCVKAGKTDYSFMGTDYKVIVEMNREIRDTNLAFKNVDKYRISRVHQALTPVSVGEPQKKRTRQS